MRTLRRSLATATAAAVLLLAGAASADPSPRECIAAADRGQVLQRQHELSLAREALRVCAAPSCPSEVQRACIGWLDAADKAQPTLAFSVTDAAGNDISGVQVMLDDQPFVSKTMGAAVEIDPGERSFRFSAPGYEPLAKKVVIVEGDKMRRVHVILAKVGGDAPPVVPAVVGPRQAPSPPPETRAPVERSGSGQKTAGIITLAAGGAGIGTGVGFLIVYVINKTNQSSDSQNNYATGSKTTVNDPCNLPSKVKSTSQTSDGCTAQNNAHLAEDVMIGTFIGGGVLAILGISLIATAPSSSPSTTASNLLTNVQLIPSITPDQASLVVLGRF